jgi:hypothetical protein
VLSRYFGEDSIDNLTSTRTDHWIIGRDFSFIAIASITVALSNAGDAPPIICLASGEAASRFVGEPL